MGSRSQMQWANVPNAGFTTAEKPWFAVNPNYGEINAKQSLADPNSIYHYFRKLIEFRKKTSALIYGDFEDLDPANLRLFTYLRSLGTDKYLIILNFSGDDVFYPLPAGLEAGQLLFSTSELKEENLSALNLKAWEGRLYRIDYPQSKS